MREGRSSSFSSSIDVQRRRRHHSISSPSQFDSRLGVSPLTMIQHRCRPASFKTTTTTTSAENENHRIICALNRGKFGRTDLVRDVNDGRFYLLKRIDRSLPERLRSALFQEEYLLSCLKSKSILSLVSSYFDPAEQCFTMKFESLSGFTLYHLLRQLRWFEESAVAFYAAQIVLLFEYLHESRIIYVRRFSSANVVNQLFAILRSEV